MHHPSPEHPLSPERRKLLTTLGALGLIGGAGLTGVLAPRTARADDWQN